MVSLSFCSISYHINFYYWTCNTHIFEYEILGIACFSADSVTLIHTHYTFESETLFYLQINYFTNFTSLIKVIKHSLLRDHTNSTLKKDGSQKSKPPWMVALNALYQLLHLCLCLNSTDIVNALHVLFFFYLFNWLMRPIHGDQLIQ